MSSGIIFIQDTARADTIERLNQQITNEISSSEHLYVTGYEKFATQVCNEFGWPATIALWMHEWNEPGRTVHRQEGTIQRIVFDMTELRETCPINEVATAHLAVRYEDDHVTYDDAFALLCAQRFQDFVACGNEEREEAVVALVCEKAGWVLPLPAHSALMWCTYNNGASLTLSVYDGVSLERAMRQYSQYFDEHSLLSADDLERDIAQCMDILNHIHDDNVNPWYLSPQEITTSKVQDLRTL